MGGDYFKLGRLPRDKYLEIEKELRAFLDDRFGRELYRIPRYYGSKPDFGDVDILLSQKALGNSSWETLKQEIVTSLNIERYSANGRTLFSTVFRNFQVDFFLVQHDVLESKSCFMDFNDLGNLIGRLFRPFGLKYSENGLYYVYRRENSTYQRDIFISRDWSKILGFVGLDHDAWVRGFDELDEMFDWILTSPYFRSSPYLGPMSRIMRNRVKQRRTIRKFIDYLEERQVDRSFPVELESDDYVPQIEAHFPGVYLRSKVEKERQLEREAIIIHSKFNGRLVMEWIPGLEGKELGQFIKTFREDFPRETLLTMSAQDVEEEVRRRYSNTT